MKKNWLSLILPLIPMILWGSLFPFIKIGYDAFNIDTESIPDILVFAAIRFLFCGLILTALAFIKKAPFSDKRAKRVWWIILSGLFSIVLHYAFTYIGLTMTDSSKTALLKQVGSLIYICFAFLFIKDERFNKFKLIGGIIGFVGIIAINFTGDSFSLEIGDVLILLASACSIVSTVMSKDNVADTSPLWNVGISQLVGGAILLAAGMIMGGKIPAFNLKSTLVFAYICSSSIIAYVLFNAVQKYSKNSTLLIIKFAEPLCACIFGAILLGEDILKIQYLLAFVLISLGIFLGSKKETEEKCDT